MNVKYGVIMDAILNIKGVKLGLHFETQTSPNGRPIRLSGICKNAKLAEKWVEINNKNELRNHWIYTFRYLDAVDGFISFEFDYYGNFVGAVKS